MNKIVDIELRKGGRMLHGVILTEGRVSQDRKEIFVPGAAEWPSTGIRVRPGHLSETGAVTGFPKRMGSEIVLTVPASKEIRSAVESGCRHMSVEFQSIEENTTPSGVREILRGMILGAAVVGNPSYQQTAAELRSGSSLSEFVNWGL